LKTTHTVQVQHRRQTTPRGISQGNTAILDVKHVQEYN